MRSYSPYITFKPGKPFGSPLIGRSYEMDTTVGYRFGFNEKEKTDEIYGDGNGVDFGGRILDSRLGRWFSIDPTESKYPFFSPYSYCANSPIVFIDPDGKTIVDSKGKEVKVTIVKNDDGSIKSITYEFAKETAKAVKDEFNANASPGNSDISGVGLTEPHSVNFGTSFFA